MTAILPDEVVYNVFIYLDSLSLSRASQCSTRFYRIATSPALWEMPYLLRWSMGDEQRESDRGTNEWRRYRKLQRLILHARRAAAEMGLPSAGTSKSPFRYLQLDKQTSTSDPPHFRPDFYRLFRERLRIDQRVLNTLYQQVETTSNRIRPVNAMARRFGSDAKDVLAAVIESQSSCPSGSSNGVVNQGTSMNIFCTDRRKDALADHLDRYRLTAYQAHLPTTLRSETHHLAIQYHARQLLEHLQRREAMQRMDELAATVSDPAALLDAIADSSDSPCIYLSKQTEKAIAMLSMFRGGEITSIEDQLDILAAACDLYIQQHPPQATETESKGSPALASAKNMALAICDFLADHGFCVAREDQFHDLDNSFLHKCFTANRETLPLSLTVIFCGIANRLGLAASLCNFPWTIIAVVMVDPSAPLPASDDTLLSAPQEMFWVSVTAFLAKAKEAHEPTSTDAFARRDSWLQQRDHCMDRVSLARFISRRGFPPSEDCWRPARPDHMAQRAINNILESVQHVPDPPRDPARDESEREVKGKRLTAKWSNLTRVDHAFLSSYHGRTDRVEQEQIASHVAMAWHSDSTSRSKGIDEDETTWGIVRNWRAESLKALFTKPEDWVTPLPPLPKLFHRYLEQRATDNDWTLTREHLIRRARKPSQFDSQVAKYLVMNVIFRFRWDQAREGEVLAGLVQIAFPLDVEVMYKDLTGMVHRDLVRDTLEDADATSEGSDSSFEASFSGREVRDGRLPSRQRQTVLETRLNPATREVVARILHATRVADYRGPRVRCRAKYQSTRRANGRAGLVAHRVGTVFSHRTYGYMGHIVGWDTQCAASEDWIVHMGVDNLPAPYDPAASQSTTRRRGRNQPFYQSITYDEQDTGRYIAEVNVEPIVGPIWIYGHPPDEAEQTVEADEHALEALPLGSLILGAMQGREAGLHFRCFDQVRGHFRRSATSRAKFPDDCSDEEDNDDDEDHPGDSKKESVERLSEDGFW
ncbi:uncharacterized protein SRS1_10438 [Sporisorium reilianum f. sp. reilianum]|uniref:F-box domain-containing protein n=1 Tax=Sporisorium reilianum f. sp. reilianum TaxID=72559 RepID=A0A2N8UAQ0_9BASI|nr:uncharacterized protein SRS1_10438 [Sporisorium reilianum f. sp. reilianum]